MGYAEAPDQGIVIFGGGTGLSVVANGLREAGMAEHVTAIVSVFDNGGLSTGPLRRQYPDMPAPGDITRVLAALSTRRELAKEFTTRLPNGHVKGNLELASRTQELGSFDLAVVAAAGRLGVAGRVIPASQQASTLVMSHYGEDIVGEDSIGKFTVTDPDARLSLQPPVSAHPGAIGAIANARKIVIAPGSLPTSLIPALLPDGMTQAVRESEADLIVVANLHAEDRQTLEGWHAADHARAIGNLIGRDPDYIFYHEGGLPDGTEPLDTSDRRFSEIAAVAIGAPMATRRETDGRVVHRGDVVAQLLRKVSVIPHPKHQYAYTRA